MTKQEARAQMKKLRRELEEKERQQMEQKIFEYMTAFLDRQKKEWFFPFVSYGTEADTMRLIEYALHHTDKKVAVPRVEQCSKNIEKAVSKNNQAQGRMEFYPIQSLSDLEKGFQGILEPKGKKPIISSDGVMLLPGLAFDRQLHRVGYGGGYYDRYLKQCDLSQLVTVAVAFDFQVVDHIEAETFDIAPEWLITDKGVFQAIETKLLS